MTGAVASKKVTEAYKGSLTGWKSVEECKGRRELDCEKYSSSRVETRS